MAYADFSVSDLYTAIITKINTQLTAVGKLFKNQTTGDYTDQVRYNSSGKKLEYWTGSAWADLDISSSTIANAATATNATTASNATTHIAAATGAEHGATTANTGNMIVRRDGSGNFSAGTISATLNGNASSATTAANVTKAVIDALGIAASSCTGNAASATTAAACSGNAASATTAANVTKAVIDALGIAAGSCAHSSNRSDAAAYPVAWLSGSPSALYSCASVTITSSTGQLSAVSFNSTSLRSSKENIKVFVADALGIIDATDINTFTYKVDESKELRIGFIADDTHEFMSGPNRDSFNINNTIGMLLKAVQQLYAEVKTLKEVK